jgi:lipid-A-disaccharide synthase
MRRDLRRVFVILPFEEAWLRDRGVRADFLGNPLLDELPDVRAPQLEAREALGFGAEDVVIGLLPGSRSREILRHMPLLVQTVQHLLDNHPHLKFVLPIAPTVDRGPIEQVLAAGRPLPVTLTTDTMRARLAMNAALCKSGTSTLELAIAGVPMVIFYITSWLNAQIARLVLTIPHIGLVNLVAGRAVAVECVQHDANPVTLSRELAAILPGTEGHRRQLEDLAQVREKLGGRGASDRLAEAILEEFCLLKD